MLRVITNAITGIGNAFVGIFKAIFGMLKGIVNAIIAVIAGIYNGIVSTIKNIVKFFKPVYKVTFTMYHVIPGVPVQENVSVHTFDKGAVQEATAFYNKVVNMTLENRLAPTEVKLFKGKKMIQSKQLGPIEEIKKFKFAA